MEDGARGLGSVGAVRVVVGVFNGGVGCVMIRSHNSMVRNADQS